MEFNKYQTPLEELSFSDQGHEFHWNTCPQEIRDEMLEYMSSVPLIRWLVSPDRPHVKDLPRDEKGRAIVDVTHPPILTDTDYFRPTALHFLETGKLTNLRPNRNPASEYMKWLNEENSRIWNGYLRESDGAYISGQMYWYLNYHPIQITYTRDGIDYRVPGMPDFWEGIWWRYIGWQDARLNKVNFAEISSRGKSKSYCLSSELSRVYTVGTYEPIPGRPMGGEKAIIMAGTKEYLTKDGTLNKFEEAVSFLADHTQYPAKSLQATLKDMTWEKGYIDLDTGTKKGTKNSVLGVAIKEDIEKGRGKRAVFIGMEEYGAFPNVDAVYNIALPSVRDGQKVFGTIVMCGTGGTEGADFSGALNMIYHPVGYGIKSYENVWDKEGRAKGESIFCFPAYVNLTGCMDKDGVSDVTKALFTICCQRYVKKYNTSDPMQLTRTKAEYPVTLQDAIMQREGSYFPAAQINDRIQEIDGDPNFYDDVYVGDLTLDGNGNVSFKPTDDIPIRTYPTKTNKVEGAIEIYAMPKVGIDGRPAYGRYIAGLDPVDADESKTLSLVSVFVLDLQTDSVVCEWTGRLGTAEECYERVRRILLFYNARLLYENNKLGVFTYFKSMNSLYLIMETPPSLRSKDSMSGGKLNNTSYGVYATADLNSTARFYIKNWLLTSVPAMKEVDGDVQEVKVLKLQTVCQRALLQEAMSWNPDGNFDRISAFGMLMLAREDAIAKLKRDFQYREGKDPTYKGNDPFFSVQYNNFLAKQKNSNKNPF